MAFWHIWSRPTILNYHLMIYSKKDWLLLIFIRLYQLYDWIKYKKANPACNYTSIELIGLYTVVLNRSVITGTEKCQYFWIYIGCALLYNASDVEYITILAVFARKTRNYSKIWSNSVTESIFFSQLIKFLPLQRASIFIYYLYGLKT